MSDTLTEYWLAMRNASLDDAAKLIGQHRQTISELRESALLTRDLPEKNEEVWAAGMNAIRAMLDDLRHYDFKDIGNAYPAVIWAAMYDAALKAKATGEV